MLVTSPIPNHSRGCLLCSEVWKKGKGYRGCEAYHEVKFLGGQEACPNYDLEQLTWSSPARLNFLKCHCCLCQEILWIGMSFIKCWHCSSVAVLGITGTGNANKVTENLLLDSWDDYWSNTSTNFTKWVVTQSAWILTMHLWVALTHYFSGFQAKMQWYLKDEKGLNRHLYQY